MSFLLSAFTGKDNVSPDIGRMIWAFMSLFMCLMVGFSVIFRGQLFDAIAFAGASAAMLTAGGAALAFKKGTEPGHDSN